MQDRIVGKIAVGIAPKVRAAELRRAMRKRPESFTAYDHMLRGLHILHGLDAQSQQRAYECLENAMREDPFYAMPFAWAAWCQVLAVGQATASDPAAAIELAGRLAGHAIELDARNALALAIYGHVKSYLAHHYEIGLQYLERAIEAGPSNALAWTLSAASLAYVGQGEQAVAHAKHAVRLSPLDQNIFFLHSNLCLAHYSHGDYDEAVRWGEICRSENPRFSAGFRLLSASLVALGEIERARVTASQMLSIEPNFSLAVYARTRQPFRDPEAGVLMIERLRIAGLPD
jgi:adenylate cyclase